MNQLTLTDRPFAAFDLADIDAIEAERLAKLRIAITYAWRHRRRVDYQAPARFTDWIQWRKLNQRDWRMPPLIDKVAVKDHVSHILGEDWVTPTLFEGTALPDAPPWAPSYVIKSRHGCRQHIFVRDTAPDWRAIRRETRHWMRKPYGFWLDEWAYGHVPRGILVEPFIGPGGICPTDYKVHVFGGTAQCIQVHRDREANRQICAWYDLDWNLICAAPGWGACPPPPSLAQMIAAAETLGRDFDFIRADFYDLDGAPRFGELTFYPASGLRPLGDRLDFWLGGLWTAARDRPHIEESHHDRIAAHAG